MQHGCDVSTLRPSACTLAHLVTLKLGLGMNIDILSQFPLSTSHRNHNGVTASWIRMAASWILVASSLCLPSGRYQLMLKVD
jgi:hypothetical protein